MQFNRKLIGGFLKSKPSKEIGGVPYVIEINYNPNIDAGIKDKVEGDAVYEALFDYFEKKINI